MYKCVKSVCFEIYCGFVIRREEYKKVDFLTGEPYGRQLVFYVVYDDDFMLESFKFLRDAKKWIEKIL